MNEIDLTKMMTMEEKAKEMGVSYRTILRWVKKGKIKFVTGKIKHIVWRNSTRKWFFPKGYKNE